MAREGNKANDAESVKWNSDTPQDHLKHLINIGWDKNSPLVRKFIEKHNIKRRLDYEQ